MVMSSGSLFRCIMSRRGLSRRGNNHSCCLPGPTTYGVPALDVVARTDDHGIIATIAVNGETNGGLS